MLNFPDEIKKLLQKHLQQELAIEIPPDQSLGDYAVPCYPLAKEMRKAPPIIALELARQLHADHQKQHKKIFYEIKATGPYINFFVDKAILTETILAELHKQKENYGKQCLGKTVMIEFSSPNTNKPLHLGHLRNIFIGESIARLQEFIGNKVIRSCVVNDRGVHICKSMLAYQRYGKGSTPESAGMKSDFFVGKWYVEFAKHAEKDKALEEDAQQLLQLWEAGDKETVALWKQMNHWVYDGFAATYKKLGITFDNVYYESKLYKHGKEIVQAGVDKGVFRHDDGAVAAELEQFRLPKKILLRSDGTAVYMTQDLYLAVKKFEDYKLNASVYVVGSEQNLHFQQLFAILELLGYPWAKECYHVSYGMVNLPDGKMKSREGKVVDADDLIKEMHDLAGYNIKLRHKDIAEKELQKRSEHVGDAALRFFMLKTDTNKDMTYDPQESIAFEGETGPYIQYTYARIRSILRKSTLKTITEKIDYSLFLDNERALIRDIQHYPAAAAEAALHYKPNLVCRYLLELCQKYNEFYHANPILTEKDEVKAARLLLSRDVAFVIKSGLYLLGIAVVEEM